MKHHDGGNKKMLVGAAAAVRVLVPGMCVSVCVCPSCLRNRGRHVGCKCVLEIRSGQQPHDLRHTQVLVVLVDP